jgi:hypothetical protein
MKELSAAVSTSLQTIAIDIISTFAQALGTALASGDITKVFQGLASILGGVIESLGEKMIALSPLIKAIELAINNFNPALLLPAGFALVALGAAIKSSFAAQKFAGGGIVPGAGNGDTVPAMLTPGEWVVKNQKFPTT